MPASTAQPSRGVTFRLTLPCVLGEVRAASQAVREFLSEQGLHEEELTACEVALVEACNNAIQYVTERGRREPVEITAACNGSKVELVVVDHTSGFNWPSRVDLPPPDSEGGRGLFLIQSVMDQSNYLRGRTENALIMRKRRCYESRRRVATPASLEEARHKLSETEHGLSEMAKELCFRTESLSAIFRCTAELGRTNDLGSFSRGLLGDLLHITSADWFVLRIIPAGETWLTTYAVSEPEIKLPPLRLPAAGQTIHSVEAEAAISRHDVWFNELKPLPESDPLRVFRPDSFGLVRPLCLNDALTGTLTVGRKHGQARFTEAQAEVVRTFGDFLAIQIANARQQTEHLNAAVMSRELEIARNIQQALLPKTLPQPRGYGLAGFCESARQVGGDFYDVIQVSEHSLLLLIADVMGNGVPAALFAAILRSLVRSSPELTRRPGELLARLNRLLYGQLSEVDMFITMQLVLVNTRKRQLITASAGHCPLLVASADEPVVQRFSPEGLPLGILPTSVFAEETLRLGQRCRVLLYTDGLTEARNASGAFFGEERLTDWLREIATRDGTAEQFKQELAASLRHFQGQTPLNDDQSFLVLAAQDDPEPPDETTDKDKEALPSLAESEPASFAAVSFGVPWIAFPLTAPARAGSWATTARLRGQRISGIQPSKIQLV